MLGTGLKPLETIENIGPKNNRHRATRVGDEIEFLTIAVQTFKTQSKPRSFGSTL